MDRSSERAYSNASQKFLVRHVALHSFVSGTPVPKIFALTSSRRCVLLRLVIHEKCSTRHRAKEKIFYHRKSCKDWFQVVRIWDFRSSYNVRWVSDGANMSCLHLKNFQVGQPIVHCFWYSYIARINSYIERRFASYFTVISESLL